MRGVLQHGDCRVLMAAMDEASVDSIVTDPPYELGFMGKEWDRSGVAYNVETWAQALRVLKPGGWLVAFGGSRTYHRMACAIEDAGFEIRDQIMWIYGSGFPKGGLDDQGRGTCLKPAHEPIVLARKPLVGSAMANVGQFGTGKLSIDACRVASGPDVNDRAAKAGVSNGVVYQGGWSERTGRPYSAQAGRWPANVCHDGSEDVLTAFPDAPGQQGDLRNHGNSRQSPNGIFGGMRPALDHPARGDSSTAARFFYCAKASKEDRDEGLDQFEPQAFVQYQTGNGESGQASSLSAGRETQYRNTHPTVKPETLMRWLVRLVTPTGGTVLDPFTGSGSTGKAAILEGRRFVGCELTAEYLPIANARIAAAEARVVTEAQTAATQGNLFEAVA